MIEIIKKLISLLPLFILGFICICLLYSLSVYYFAKKMNLSKTDRVLSFIPILQSIPYLHTIRLSGWNILLLLIPIYNIFALLKWEIKTLKQFKAPTFLVVLLFIPLLNVLYIILRFYFSINPKYKSKVKQGNKGKASNSNSYYDIYGNKKSFNANYVDDIILDDDFEREYKKYKTKKV